MEFEISDDPQEGYVPERTLWTEMTVEQLDDPLAAEGRNGGQLH